MALILPDRKILKPDPWIEPNFGNRGPCALCGSYSKLTDAHIPPESVGNVEKWITQSYTTTISAGGKDKYFGRNFNGGLRFKTLCGDCNSGLGGKGDAALADFYGRVRKIVESPVFVGKRTKVPAKPNLIYKAILAHIVSANDSGRPSRFDAEARDLYWGRRPLWESNWNLFYWPFYAGQIFLMRHVYHFVWHPRPVLYEMHLLKLAPLAFLLVQSPRFYGLPNMRQFIQRRDEEQVEVPMQLVPYDLDPVWPAMTSERNIIILGGSSFGLVGRRA